MTELPISALIRTESTPAASVGGHVHSREVLFSTCWLELSSVSYSLTSSSKSSPANTEQKIRKWDVVGRSTRTAQAADAVAVLATFSLNNGGDNDLRVLLVKQFRPPVGAVCVELPAGLIDEGESISDAALRELEEETGFTGRVTHVSRPQPLSPGLSAETVCVVEVDIERIVRKPQMIGDAESIEVVSVPLRRLRDCLNYLESQGCLIMHGVGGVAAGLDLGLRLQSLGT
jgi:ADP-ribose pyrophosphatase